MDRSQIDLVRRTARGWHVCAAMMKRWAGKAEELYSARSTLWKSQGFDQQLGDAEPSKCEWLVPERVGPGHRTSGTLMVHTSRQNDLLSACDLVASARRTDWKPDEACNAATVKRECGYVDTAVLHGSLRGQRRIGTAVVRTKGLTGADRRRLPRA